jgi:hypothetical protein
LEPGDRPSAIGYQQLMPASEATPLRRKALRQPSAAKVMESVPVRDGDRARQKKA